MAKILFVEDDLAFSESIVKWLETSHQVSHVTTAEAALLLLNERSYDCIIVDWELPGKSGFELVDSFRKAGGHSPMLFLTGRADLSSKLTGLDGGADDFLTKPCNARELSARIEVLIRRGTGKHLQDVITIGEVKLNLANRQITIRNKLVRFTQKEYDVLEFLMRHNNQSFSTTDLLLSIWPSETETAEGAVRQILYALRRKLKVEELADFVKTQPGGGYVIEGEAAL